MKGLDNWLDRCTFCGQTACYGTCVYDEIKPQDGDSADDARAADLGLDTWSDEDGLSALERRMFE